VKGTEEGLRWRERREHRGWPFLSPLLAAAAEEEAVVAGGGGRANEECRVSAAAGREPSSRPCEETTRGNYQRELCLQQFVSHRINVGKKLQELNRRLRQITGKDICNQTATSALVLQRL
jgi:hypothetical protein